MSVAVMGTGSWGTTFAMVLADAGARVTMWGRRAQVCAQIRDEHRNTEYLGQVQLPPSLGADPDPAAVLAGARTVVLAVPAQRLRDNLLRWRELIPSDCLLVSLMKGVEHGSMLRMSQVIAEVTGAAAERIAVVSGPNLAAEIAQRRPTATVVAGSDPDVVQELAAACSTSYFRPYTNSDLVGVELGGAVKNVIGLAVGMAEGMGLGDNAKASVITRGLAETTRLGVAMGADPLTFAGLAGLGDLVATCASPLSRNRSFGVHLGQGRSVADTEQLTKRTAEGVRSCGPVLALARAHAVDMPITAAVTSVVHEGSSPAQMIASLFSRARKHELR